MATLSFLKCSMPQCSNTVGQHSKRRNKNKQVCAAHRTIKKHEVDNWKLSLGCQNKDGHYGDGRYGFKCVCTTIRTPASLDINHIDGDNDNREPSNIEVLCKMCHSEVTIQQEHHLSGTKKKREATIDPDARSLFVFQYFSVTTIKVDN